MTRPKENKTMNPLAIILELVNAIFVFVCLYAFIVLVVLS
jgi:hypothetical protein